MVPKKEPSAVNQSDYQAEEQRTIKAIRAVHDDRAALRITAAEAIARIGALVEADTTLREKLFGKGE